MSTISAVSEAELINATTPRCSTVLSRQDPLTLGIMTARSKISRRALSATCILADTSALNHVAGRHAWMQRLQPPAPIDEAAIHVW